MGIARKVVLVICQSDIHGMLGKLRYIFILHEKGVGLVDDATWKDFKQITRSYPWTVCEIRFAPCRECEVIKSLM